MPQPGSPGGARAPHQSCLFTQLEVEPTPAVLGHLKDFFENHTTFFTVQEPHVRLMVTAVNVTGVVPLLPPEPALTPPWENVRNQLAWERSPEVLDAYQFAFDSPYIRRDPELTAYAEPSFPPGRPVLEAALDLTRRIHADFRYDKTATTTATPLAKCYGCGAAFVRILLICRSVVSGRWVWRALRQRLFTDCPPAGPAAPGWGRRFARLAGAVLPGERLAGTGPDE